MVGLTDRGIFTMEDKIKLYVLYQIVPLSMTLSDPEPQFQGHSRPKAYSLKANISQTMHPIHSMFGSSPGFSGSADRMALFPVLSIKSKMAADGHILLLGGELLAERCRTDDSMPNIPISCLPPCCMDPKVQGLDILIYCSRPTGLLQSVGGLRAAAMTRW